MAKKQSDDSKKLSETYKEFKYFKNIYPYISGLGDCDIQSGKLFFTGLPNYSYYKVHGELKSDESLFDEYAKTHQFHVNLTDIVKLKKCLKKNVLSAEIINDELIYKFIDKESGVEDSVVFKTSAITDETIETVYSEVIDFDKISMIPICLDNPKSEVFKFYDSVSNEKILEIPYSDIIIAKKDMSYTIGYSVLTNREDLRYVKIDASNDIINLTLSMFAI